MTIKEVSSVIDDINEWQGQHGSVWYVTAMFTDETVGSAGKKSYDAALEVQGLLREAIGVEQDFQLESQGQTKTGRNKFKILGFGTPGGAAIYTAPGVQGGGTASASGGGAPGRGRSPEHDQFIQERMDRRTALMQAVQYLPQPDIETLAEGMKFDGDGARANLLALWLADELYAWLRTTSEPASSAYAEPVVITNQQAGMGSETTSPVSLEESASVGRAGGGSIPSTTAGDTSSEGVGFGEGPAPSEHIHDWYPHPNLRGKLKCDCGTMRTKEGAVSE